MKVRILNNNASPKKVLIIGFFLSLLLSIILFVISYFLNISELLAKSLEAIKYIYLLLWGALLFKSSKNGQSSHSIMRYKVISLFLIAMGVYSAYSLFSSQGNVTKATSLYSMADIAKEFNEEQNKKKERAKQEKERSKHKHYRVCKNMAHWKTPALEGYTFEAQQQHDDQYDKIYDGCIRDFEIKHQQCITSFNQEYIDQGLDPDLYSNIRDEEVQKCLPIKK